IDRQIKLLRQGAHMIIGTPGRILDHIARNTIKLGKLKTVVLDEADEMLNMGFRDDIEEILSYTPEKRQTVLFSATMPKAIMQIVHKYQKDPVTVKTVTKQLTVPKIIQSYYDVPAGKKTDTLCTIIEELNPSRSIVFCNTKRMVDNLAGELSTRGYLAAGIHGDMRQIVRTNVMRSFKNGTTDILIATDVAARGIDVEDIDIVFNYDIPTDSEYYVHRIGRTGRAGKDGMAISFVCGRKEAEQLKSVVRSTKSRITYKKAPSGEMVERARLHSLMFKVENELKKRQRQKYLELIDELTIGKYNVEDVCCALISAFVTDNDDFSPKDVMEKIEFSCGSNDGIEPKHILGSITSSCGIDGENIGKIRIEKTFSIVEVQKAFSDLIAEKMDGCRIKGCIVKVKKK
ncbi:MAG: DEAD/DEAH box helicase, partial [Clostridia bacterium]|nr:DEAD/DEAH box helicase [Clostridia bacterium]